MADLVKRILYKDVHNLGHPYEIIYPTHQLAVYKLVNKLPKDNVIAIVLFGSLLDYSAHQGSDIDIAIISTDYPLDNTSNCWSSEGFPVDILVIHPDELFKYKDAMNTTYNDIYYKGEVMYYGGN